MDIKLSITILFALFVAICVVVAFSFKMMETEHERLVEKHNKLCWLIHDICVALDRSGIEIREQKHNREEYEDEYE